MPNLAPQPPPSPVAQFTVTVGQGGVTVTDHADRSQHTFTTLLGALGYMELVCRSRQHAAQDGGLL
ncbi:hypothetical protein [Deinococcus yunweiensis]|uniref:hypothetical protein n=1 Tax=Deinococcus yunweiensis TaxID=367282 RepID=UPI00398F00A8